MNARLRDPARVALERVLRLTLKKKRFPLERTALRLREGLGDAIRRLLDDGRYVARVVAGDEDGLWPSRVALTVLGTYELPPPRGTTEVQGLTRTYQCLQHGSSARMLSGIFRLEEAHKVLAPDMDLLDFRRWATTLTSPRLQGRYAFDATGFAGRADATGIPTKQKGFFTELQLHSTFSTWELPPQDPPQPFLLAEAGPQVEVDVSGNVHVYSGMGELAVLRPSVGSRVLAALMKRPGEAIDSLDLQAYEPGRFEIPDPDDWDAWEVSDALVDLGIEFDTSSCAPEQILRIGAVVRRILALEAVARSDEPPPRWGTEPLKRKAELVADLRAALPVGPLCADFPVIKNATKVVRRALDGVLEREELQLVRGCFADAERIVYRPPA